MNQFHAIVRLPFTTVGVVTKGECISQIEFLASHRKPMKAINSVAQRCVDQLLQFSEDPSYEFDVPLDLSGTDYQLKVWQALQNIGPGDTLTYGQLSQSLKSSPRAIGNACRHNPVPIIIPCHRVVAKTGIGGFAGQTQGPKLNVKRLLLQHENNGQHH